MKRATLAMLMALAWLVSPPLARADRSIASALAQARERAHAGRSRAADSTLTLVLANLPMVTDRDDSVRVAAEATWLQSRIRDQMPFDSTFRARARAVVHWQEVNTRQDREARIRALMYAAKYVAIADSMPAANVLMALAQALAQEQPPVAPAVRADLAFLAGQMAYGGNRYGEAVQRYRLADSLAHTLGPAGSGLSYRAKTDLALALRSAGQLVEARAVYEELLGIASAAPVGEGRVRGMVQSLSGIASVTADLNDPLGARKTYDRISELAHGVLPEDDPFLLQCDHRRAMMMRALGEYDSALVIASRVARLRRERYGPEYTEYAASLGLEGSLLCDLSRFDEAEPKLREAYRIDRVHRGAEDINTLAIVINLGNLARARGDDAAAETLFTALVAGRRARLGSHHVSVAEALYNLALAHAWTGHEAAAVDAALEAADIRAEVWSATIPFLSEREALQFVDEWWTGHEVAIDLLAHSSHPDSAAISRTWDRVTSLRTLVLDEFTHRHNALAQRDSTRDREVWEAWTRARSELSRVALSGYDMRRDPGMPARRDSLAHAADSLQRILGRNSAALRAELALLHTSDAAIRARVDTGAVLVGLVHYGRVKRARPIDRWYKDLDQRYAAFIRDGRTGRQAVVDLGDAEHIDTLVTQWSQALERTAPDVPRTLQRYRLKGAALRRAIWDPLEPYLRHARRVDLVPDHNLSQVVWETLPTTPGRYLLDAPYELVRLFSERDLVSARPDTLDGGLLACGGIDYDGRDEHLVALRAGYRERGARSQCEAFAGLRFGPLPGTAEEVHEVGDLWKRARSSSALILSGRGATTDRLVVEAPRRSFLHLATHGFFVADSCLQSGKRQEDFLHDPLARCGLVMAGSNLRQHLTANGDDGLLTGVEIAMLDLQSCDCAVLSSCASASGDAGHTEGIFGLQRAFRLAGAHAIVMDACPVDDEAARIWMREFYRYRLVPGGQTAAAAHAASRAVRARLIAAHRSPAPRWWGAFFAAGDPR